MVYKALLDTAKALLVAEVVLVPIAHSTITICRDEPHPVEKAA
jgi:hypothetical protein